MYLPFFNLPMYTLLLLPGPFRTIGSPFAWPLCFSISIPTRTEGQIFFPFCGILLLTIWNSICKVLLCFCHWLKVHVVFSTVHCLQDILSSVSKSRRIHLILHCQSCLIALSWVSAVLLLERLYHWSSLPRPAHLFFNSTLFSVFFENLYEHGLSKVFCLFVFISPSFVSPTYVEPITLIDDTG